MRLPGVNYTDDQLFFITYGQVQYILSRNLILPFLIIKFTVTDLVRSAES